jgi:hypothetical protein
VKEVIETMRECTCADLRFDRIAKRHFLERKKQIGPSFYGDGVGGDLRVTAGVQQPPKRRLIKRGMPTLVCIPFVTPLPIDVERIMKSLGEVAQKFGVAAAGGRG